MHGNVYEWCEDWYSSEGRPRVDRGGSWYHAARHCWSSSRIRYPPSYRFNYLGFRVAAVPSSQRPEAEKRESEADSGGR